MLGMISAQVDVAQYEPFIKARDATILADASLKGVLPLARAATAELIVTNNDNANFTLAADRRLTDSKGRVWMVDASAVIGAKSSKTITCAQRTARTISRAVALVGLAGIRNLALSLVLVEHMKDKDHAQRLKEEFLRSLLAGQLAHALGPAARDAEEAFLGAMFYNLGKLLTEYYFPEEADAIRAQMRLNAATGAARKSCQASTWTLATRRPTLRTSARA